jgi:hypothetical protein
VALGAIVGVSLSGLGCSGSPEQQAVVATAAMVAAVAANRALTGECWAACTPGYVCDHESGLCVEGECTPRCDEEQVCARVAEQLVCVDKGTAFKLNQTRSPGYVVLPAGGAPAAAPAAAPQPSTTQLPCATPGSAAWYAEQASTPGAPEPLARHADFVGIWLVAGQSVNGDLAPRPLIVVREWFGRSRSTASDYRALEESDEALLIEVSSAQSSGPSEVLVEFTSRDSLRLFGVAYQRVDCTADQPSPACCELPREAWVRLVPLGPAR